MSINSILKQNNLLSLYHNHVWHSVDCSKVWSPNQHNEKSKRIAADQIAEKNTSHALKMNYVSVTFKIPISSLVSNELWGDVNWLCKWTTLKCKEAEFNLFGLLDKRSLPKSRRQNFGFWPMGGSLTLNLTFFLQNIRQLNTWFFWALPFVGKGKYTKSEEFLEKFQRPSTTPPSFLENYIANFL